MAGKTSESDMDPEKESKIIGKCLEEEKCLDSLRLILDGEASTEEEKYFFNHLQQCMPCFHMYSLEKALKEVVQSKIEKKKVPHSLVSEIKERIQGIKESA